MLTASGLSASGQSAQSATILIDVERPDLPISLSALMPSITFGVQGQQFPVITLATFADGTILDVTQSSNISYSSLNPGVAIVDPTGLLTGVAPGNTSLQAIYGQGSSSVSVSIPVTVPALVLSPSPTSLSFGSQDVGTNSAQQQSTLTNGENGPIGILGVHATGDFSESDDCVSSSPLALNATCTINVSFTPTATGLRTGMVYIDNRFTTAPLGIRLTGTGTGSTKTPTSVAIASSANPSVFGQSVTLTATVSPSSGSTFPSGTIAFLDGSNNIGTATLSGAQATLTLSSFAVASHSITATYSGDNFFFASISPAFAQAVNKASTATSLSASANPVVLNRSVTFAASVSVLSPGSGTPTGTITFQDGTTALGTVALNSSGSASFAASSLSVAAHQIIATYNGDANFTGSTGNLTENISYGICVLYDQTKSVNGGATFPIKLYLCDSGGNDVSSLSVVLHATQVTTISGFSGPIESPGNANPDNDFRFDSTLGPVGGYIFNLGTTGLASGTYSLQFTAGADPVLHAVNFGVK